MAAFWALPRLVRFRNPDSSPLDRERYQRWWEFGETDPLGSANLAPQVLALIQDFGPHNMSAGEIPGLEFIKLWRHQNWRFFRQRIHNKGLANVAEISGFYISRSLTRDHADES